MKIEGVFSGLFGSDSQRESGSQPAPRGGTIRAGPLFRSNRRPHLTELMEWKVVELLSASAKSRRKLW